MVVVDERDISKQEMMDGDLLNQEQWSRWYQLGKKAGWGKWGFFRVRYGGNERKKTFGKVEGSQEKKGSRS